MPVLNQDAMLSSMRAEMEAHVPIRPISVLTPVLALQVLLELIVKLRFRAAADHVKTVELARIQRISGPISVLALQVLPVSTVELQFPAVAVHVKTVELA